MTDTERPRDRDETLAELEARIIALCWGGELAQLPLPRAMRIQGDCLGDVPDRELFLSYRAQRLLDEEAQGAEEHGRRPRDPMELPYLDTSSSKDR